MVVCHSGEWAAMLDYADYIELLIIVIEIALYILRHVE
jgi:hypothetical protein